MLRFCSLVVASMMTAPPFPPSPPSGPPKRMYFSRRKLQQPLPPGLSRLLASLVERLGGVLSAAAAAWILAVALGSTAWQARVSAAGGWIGGQLQAWSEAAAGTAVVGPVARILSAAYDAGFGALGSVAGALGLGLTIFVLGAVVGGTFFWVAARRRSAVRGRSAHHA